MASFPFPPEFVKPSVKELPEYGVQYIKAGWFSTDRFGAGVFTDDLQINSLIEIAQGRESTQSYKKLFGQFEDKRSDNDDGPNSLIHIDPQILNFAPKYINRCVAKMQARQFEFGLEAIDIVSSDQRESYAAALKAFYNLKGWTAEMGVPLQKAFDGMDVDTLPMYPDEMLYDIATNPKLKQEIAGELSLQLVQSINRYPHKMRQARWNMAVTGWGHIDCFQDVNGIPRMKVVPHEYWGGSYVDSDDFEDQEYAFYIEPITVNQFIKEASPYYNQQQLKEIAYRYSIQNSQYTAGITGANFDNLSYIPVVRFYFLSEDNRAYVKQPGNYSATVLKEKDFNYQIPSDKLGLFEKGERKLIKNTYTSVYGGSWIVNSDIVYNYGRKKFPRTNLVNTSLPIKTFATNYKKGRAVSFTSQIIEPLYMINVAHNKIKEVLAKGWMGIRNLDLSAIEQAALGKGGNVWTPREVLEYLNMSNTAVGRRNAGNQYGQSNGDIVTVSQSGVQLADYFNTISMYVNILDQMTGSSVIEQAQVPDRLPAKAIGASQASSDIDMEYLYHASDTLEERVSHTLLLLTQEAMKDDVTIRSFIPALGKVNTGVYKVPKEIAYCEYGIRLVKKPGVEEWADFYQDVREALIAGVQGLPGGIKLSDATFLREIDNLKQARQMMVIKEGQYRREMMQLKEQDNRMAMESNQAAAQAKFQGEAQKMSEQGKIEAYLKELQGKIDMMKQDQKAQLDSSTKRIGDEMSRVIKDIEGKYSVLKEGFRSKSEDYKTDKSYDAKVYAADRAAEASVINTDKKIKQQAKTKTKK